MCQFVLDLNTYNVGQHKYSQNTNKCQHSSLCDNGLKKLAQFFVLNPIPVRVLHKNSFERYKCNAFDCLIFRTASLDSTFSTFLANVSTALNNVWQDTVIQIPGESSTNPSCFKNTLPINNTSYGWYIGR